jgi:hypothetical protein
MEFLFLKKNESKGPAQVYMEFKEACDIGDLATAESPT